jgi:hypothetical protein
MATALARWSVAVFLLPWPKPPGHSRLRFQPPHGSARQLIITLGASFARGGPVARFRRHPRSYPRSPITPGTSETSGAAAVRAHRRRCAPRCDRVDALPPPTIVVALVACSDSACRRTRRPQHPFDRGRVRRRSRLSALQRRSSELPDDPSGVTITVNGFAAAAPAASRRSGCVDQATSSASSSSSSSGTSTAVQPVIVS